MLIHLPIHPRYTVENAAWLSTCPRQKVTARARQKVTFCIKGHVESNSLKSWLVGCDWSPFDVHSPSLSTIFHALIACYSITLATGSCYGTLHVKLKRNAALHPIFLMFLSLYHLQKNYLFANGLQYIPQ